MQETAKLNTVQNRLSEAEVRLTDLWERVLQTKSIAPDDNFYDLGGDSFSSAALICCIEEEFDCQLPIEAFFNDPTIANMAALLANAPRKSLIADHTNQQRHILRDLQNYLGCWKGKRLVPGGLIVGANTSGSMDPIFWVFQEQNEFERLSIHLGSDQPLYGMRSLVGLMRIRNYPEVLDVIATSYAKEILTLKSSRIILGGNCQGGIIALAIARKLNQVGRAPAPLILMEWNFNYGRYSGPTVLLYGRNSHTAKSFESAAKPDPDWRADFPRRIVIPIEEGRHGEFFGEKYIMNLAATLKASLRAQIPTTTSSSPPPDLA